MKRVTAAPIAKRPAKTAKKLSLKAGIKLAKPTNRKNRIINHVERALGVFIFISLGDVLTTVSITKYIVAHIESKTGFPIEKPVGS